MKSLFFYITIFTSLLLTNVSAAKPPYIDYMYTNVEWRLTSCLKDARKAMNHAGFTETGSTGNHELVGAKGNYKSTIVCIDDNDDGLSEITLFIVSGVAYKKSSIFNRKQKEYWDGLN